MEIVAKLKEKAGSHRARARVHVCACVCVRVYMRLCVCGSHSPDQPRVLTPQAGLLSTSFVLCTGLTLGNQTKMGKLGVLNCPQGANSVRTKQTQDKQAKQNNCKPGYII